MQRTKAFIVNARDFHSNQMHDVRSEQDKMVAETGDPIKETFYYKGLELKWASAKFKTDVLDKILTFWR